MKIKPPGQGVPSDEDFDPIPDIPVIKPKPVPTPSPEGGDVQQRILQLKEFFEKLNKSIKNISLYRHATAQYGKFLEPAFAAMDSLLQEHGNITLSVEQWTFKIHQAVVYDAEPTEQNLAFRFYRDGVRLLTFREGLDEQELLDFILLCLTNFKDPEFAGEDMVSLMWKQDLAHIEHVVMETFALGKSSSEETKIEVDKIVNYLYHSLTTVSKDSLQFAHLSMDDLELELDNIEQVSGLRVEGEVLKQGDLEAIAKDLEQDLALMWQARFATVLLGLFKGDLDEDLGSRIEVGLVILIDSFLMLENLRGLEWLMRNLERISDRDIPLSSSLLLQHLRVRMADRISEPERVDHLAGVLEKSANQKQLDLARSLLKRLGPASVDTLLTALERMTRPEARAVMCDTLVAFGMDSLDKYIARLTSPKANYVRDMLAVIQEIDPPDKLKIAANLLQHPNLAIRLEALKVVAGSKSRTASAYLTKALRDSDPQVRVTAARLLPQSDAGVAKRSLMALVAEDGFRERPSQEQMVIWSVLASLEDPDVFDYFREQLHSSSLMQKKQLAEMKKNLIKALASSVSIGVYRFLASEQGEGFKDDELQKLVERACVRMKERLLGGTGG